MTTPTIDIYAYLDQDEKKRLASPFNCRFG